jgi:hypothetical protein
MFGGGIPEKVEASRHLRCGSGPDSDAKVDGTGVRFQQVVGIRDVVELEILLFHSESLAPIAQARFNRAAAVVLDVAAKLDQSYDRARKVRGAVLEELLASGSVMHVGTP